MLDQLTELCGVCPQPLHVEGSLRLPDGRHPRPHGLQKHVAPGVLDDEPAALGQQAPHGVLVRGTDRDRGQIHTRDVHGGEA